VDQFREKTGKRPWVGREKSDIYIDVHISHNVCTVSLDSSGESLHRRGYRIDADKAPINEVLAAGMVKLTGWKGDKDFYDPMCGSGTIPIEAAFSAMNIPAGYYRQDYAFMSWADFDDELWKKVKEEADAEMGELECRILASDRSEKAVAIARRNLKNTGLHKDVELKVSYFDSIQPDEKKGILVFNPPYGKRLEEKGEIIDLYKGIGDVLKKNFIGFEAWIISSNFDAAKFIGLRPSARIPLYNGPIETKFIKFEMYEGSKKDNYEQEGKKDFRPKRTEYRKTSFKGKPSFKGKSSFRGKDNHGRNDNSKAKFRPKKKDN
jgi:putative N6-adenine-specific DNA methylase